MYLFVNNGLFLSICISCKYRVAHPSRIIKGFSKSEISKEHNLLMPQSKKDVRFVLVTMITLSSQEASCGQF